MAAVAGQPTAVTFQITGNLMDYKSGIFTGRGGDGSVACTNSSSAPVNHAVLIVGFGSDTDTGLDYWLVKNSWSDTWGEDGYVRIARGTDDEDGVCSINTLASYPIV